MPAEFWKVGELAARTGLTVRTLHHYDAIGLLCPSGRTESNHGSGHRLYTAADVKRLHQILCLKQLGFSLEQVQEYLTRDDYDPRQVIRMHLEKSTAKRSNWPGSRNDCVGFRPYSTGRTRCPPTHSCKPLRR